MVVAAILSSYGCSISHSISSSSDSSTSISRSSSGPEVSEETKNAYIKDVATYTEAIGTSQISGEDFMRGLSRIAKKHGISDWESCEYTYEGIGQGLKATGIPKDKIADLPYLKILISNNEKRLEYIKEVY